MDFVLRRLGYERAGRTLYPGIRKPETVLGFCFCGFELEKVVRTRRFRERGGASWKMGDSSRALS